MTCKKGFTKIQAMEGRQNNEVSLEKEATGTISKAHKEDRKASVDWAILNMLLFLSVLVNYVYTAYLAQAFVSKIHSFSNLSFIL